MKRFLTLIAGAFCSATVLSATVSSHAASEPSHPFPATLRLTPIAGGLEKPTAIANAGDGSNRLFILEQKGLIRIIRDGKLLPRPFLDITKEVKWGGERGLLGIAFPPDFTKRREFFVDYTNRRGIGNTVIARFAVSSDPDRADPASEKKILGVLQPFPNHKGGQLAFGPDRYLYIGMGDGGSGGDPFGNGQNIKSHLGKILRIDVLSGASPYGIPPGNPFKSEVWAYGLRNPWRFSFDRATGEFYLADVGQNEVEEIDYQPRGAGAGANYGWNIMEGSRCYKKSNCRKTGLAMPVAEYYHGHGDCSIIGGYVYRGSIAALKGIYLYGDFCSGRIWGLRKEGSKWETKLLKDSKLRISTFGEDEHGEVYVADYASGTIYRIGVP